jgi:N6-adenosine-specific RNA methylase IME4
LPLHYGAIYADPPWSFATYSHKGKGRSAEAHYDCMGLDEIKAMPAADWAAPDSALFLWATDPLLPRAFEVIAAWGFVYKTVPFTWVKTTKDGAAFRIGCGYWTRANPELCLLATRGRPERISRSVRQLILAPRGAHSQKPDEVYERIGSLVPGPYLELFARQRRPGWASWGKEVETGISQRRWRADSYQAFRGTPSKWRGWPVTTLPGSLGDLVARAEGRPIYCTAPMLVHRSLITSIVSSFRQEFPSAIFVNARTGDRRENDRLRHWRTECEQYGAGIVVTRGEGRPETADLVTNLAGEHVVSISVGLEINELVRLGRPVGWHPVAFPATYWLARFSVAPLFEIMPSRYARLLPAPGAEPFQPIIGSWPSSDAGDA